MQTLNKTQKTTPCFKLDEIQAKDNLEVVRAAKRRESKASNNSITPTRRASTLMHP